LGECHGEKGIQGLESYRILLEAMEHAPYNIFNILSIKQSKVVFATDGGLKLDSSKFEKPNLTPNPEENKINNQIPRVHQPSIRRIMILTTRPLPHDPAIKKIDISFSVFLLLKNF
jgi:hypothetical protein